MFAGIERILMDDLTAVDPVLQHPIKRTSAKRLAAPPSARSTGPAFAGDALRLEFSFEQPHRAERGVAAEDVTHPLGLGFDDDKLAVLCRVAERRHAAHTH